MSFTKLSAVFLSLVLVGGVLTGCGKSDGPPLDTKRIAADEKRGIRFSADKRALVKYNKDLPDKGYVIPDGVTSIGEGAFKKCKLERVTIPSSVTTIGDCAFAGCKKVEVSPKNPNFYLDASGALIDRNNKKLLFFPQDFSGAYYMPDGVTSIGEWAFAGCKKLTSVTIPSSVTTIGKAAFVGCEKIEVAPDNRNFHTDAFGALIDRGNKKILYLPPAFSGAYAIPDGVKIIDMGAFAGCDKLTSVTIPSSVTTIGEVAFAGCDKLTSVTIPSSVTTIGKGVFVGCDNLTSVTIPPGVKTIGAGAFAGCKNLTSVTIQAGVKTIGEWAFYWCWNLTEVTIPPSVTTIGERAFAGCPCEEAVKKQFPNYR